MQSKLHPPLPGSRSAYKGTSQKTRLLVALDPASAPVDDRSESELLVWAAGFSRTVNFFNQENQVEGNWGAFFATEPIVQYAMMDMQDMKLREAVLQEQLWAWQNSPMPKKVVLAEGNLLTLLYDQCQRINRWQIFFGQRTEEHVFASGVDSAIELKMSLALDTARQWEAAVAACGPDILGSFKLENDLSSFDAALWQLGMGPSWPQGDEDWRKRELPGVLVAAFQAEAGLVKAGRKRLHTLLAAPSEMAPHFALYLAFVRQMRQHAQAELNALTGQHLKLFYQTVLEERPAAPVADRAHVVFGMAQGAIPFQLPAGTKLATKDAAGQPAVYGLNEPMDINGCSIGQLLTASVWPVAPATGAAEDVGLCLRCTPVDPVATQPWPMFGPGPTAASAPTTRAEVGFAIASPCLHLEGGLRTVTLTICFARAEAKPDLKMVTPVALAAAEAGVAYSGVKGWVTPSRGTFKLDFSTPLEVVATVVITLQPEDPPWVKFDPKVMSGTFDPSCAVLKMMQSQWAQTKYDKLPPQCDSAVEIFSWLLGAAKVVSMDVQVKVWEAPVVILANDQGPLVPGAPMLPFGSAPALKSSLYLRYPELQAKRMQSATLHLYWQNLPLDAQLYPGGLEDYYGAYAVSLLRAHPALTPPPFSLDAYQVEVDGKVGGSWQSLSKIRGKGREIESVFPLFNPPQAPSQPSSPQACAGPDPTLRHSAFFAPAPPPSPPVTTGPETESIGAETKFELWFDSEPVVALADLDGSFRVQLQQPSYAFGHAIYPQVMTDVVMQNAETMMALAQLDAATEEQILERWGMPMPSAPAGSFLQTLEQFFAPAPTQYQLSPTLFAILNGLGLKPPAVFPEGVTGDKVVTALLGLEKKNFTDRSDLDKLIIDKIYPSPPVLPPELHGDLLLAIYRWIDRLLGGVTSLLPLPPPPLNPALSGLAVSYTTSFSVSFAADGGADHCHQILPFATPRLLLQSDLMPALMERGSGGCLYVGLMNVAAGQKVSLLWVLQDQRADSGSDTPKWSVLCHEGWVRCKAVARTLKDQTYGLQKSGLVQVAIPAEMDDRSPRMPPGPPTQPGLPEQPICWLRIQSQTPACFPAVVQILPQAGVVTYLPDAANGQAAAHFSQPLAAGALKALQQPDPRVKSILQPLPSFGGRAAESEPEFLTRVSERLRHKGRAWTAWDYERLLLQQFPGIYYARCLPHTCTAFTKPEHAPGHVQVVVLPLLAQAPGVLPPGFATAELKKVECWLRERASPAVQLRVSNPVYETLRLTITAVFDESQPVGTVQARLNAELREFISPWVYQPQTVSLPLFEFHLGTLRAFILARPYVKSLSACAYEAKSQGIIDGDWIRPSHAWSLLITAEEHVFNPHPPRA